jgi:hypothetical protein
MAGISLSASLNADDRVRCLPNSGPAVAGGAAALAAHYPTVAQPPSRQHLVMTATRQHLGSDPPGYGLLDMAGL